MENAPAKAAQVVRFLVTDLVHPPPARVLMEMFQQLRLEGEVAAATSDGRTSFLVVRIAGLADPVIVPLDKTQSVDHAPCPSAAGT
jgi:hypothetical protein